MKTKPTRFTGWAGKNLAVSLATRRRRSTTIHGTGDARKEHVFRIEAPSATVKRSRPPERPLYEPVLCIFLHRYGTTSILSLHDNSRHGIRVSGDVHGQTGAAAGDGAVGCFFFQGAGGKFSGGIF